MECLAQGPLRLAEGCLWAEQRRLGLCLGLKPLQEEGRRGWGPRVQGACGMSRVFRVR